MTPITEQQIIKTSEFINKILNDKHYKYYIDIEHIEFLAEPVSYDQGKTRTLFIASGFLFNNDKNLGFYIDNQNKYSYKERKIFLKLKKKSRYIDFKTPLADIIANESLLNNTIIWEFCIVFVVHNQQLYLTHQITIENQHNIRQSILLTNSITDIEFNINDYYREKYYKSIINKPIDKMTLDEKKIISMYYT